MGAFATGINFYRRSLSPACRPKLNIKLNFAGGMSAAALKDRLVQERRWMRLSAWNQRLKAWRISDNWYLSFSFRLIKDVRHANHLAFRTLLSPSAVPCRRCIYGSAKEFSLTRLCQACRGVLVANEKHPADKADKVRFHWSLFVIAVGRNLMVVKIAN